MRVMIIRHGKVLHDWKKWCTSAEFDEQCALYDKAPIDKASVDTVQRKKTFEVFSGSGASINSVLEDLPITLRCSFLCVKYGAIVLKI